MGLLTQSDFEALIWQIEHSRSTDGTKDAVIAAYAAALARIASLEAQLAAQREQIERLLAEAAHS